MPTGSKASYTSKQKRQAAHIEKGYKAEGVSQDRAEEIAWATVNKLSDGGKKSGSGRTKARAPKHNSTARRGNAQTGS